MSVCHVLLLMAPPEFDRTLVYCFFNSLTDKSPLLGHARTSDSRLPTQDTAHSKPASLSLDTTGKPRAEKESPGSPHDAPKTRRFGRQPALMIGPDTKVFVVWLENFEDFENFPAGIINLWIHVIRIHICN